MRRRRPVRAALLVAWSAWLTMAAPTRAQEPAPAAVVDALVAAACAKRVVLLGELPSHGEAQAFDIKSRVVERLVGPCGFSAVLFEAPIYDFIGLARAAEAGAATPAQLDNAIGRFWWTRELAPWRARLFEAATRRVRPLVMGGLDDQVSITSRYARAMLPGLVATASTEARAAECRAAVARHLDWTYDAATPFDDREKRRLHECAGDAAAAAATQSTRDASDRAMLASFARYAERQRLDAPTGRDSSMFRNLTWYLDRLPADARVVVWTATVHAAKQRGPLAEEPLGAQVSARLGDQVLSVGFTARAGSSSMAGRPARPLEGAPAGTLEAVATRESPIAVLDSRHLRALGPVPSRLLGTFTTQPWATCFDLVVVIGEERAPTFDPWK